MTLPPNSSDPNSDKELERTSELLERYLFERDELQNDRELRAFGAENPHLIRAAKELRSSWHNSFKERSVNVPPLNKEMRVGATSRQNDSHQNRSTEKTAGASSAQLRSTPRNFFSNARNVSLSLGIAAVAVIGGLWVNANSSVFTGPATYQAQGNETYITKRGERTRVQLVDGSTVILAPESRLTLSPGANSIRDVTLEGEGYFAVNGNPEDPFIVRSGTGVVRVLGTEFSVRNYLTDNSVRVAVASGRISFSTSDNSASERNGSAASKLSENAHYVVLNAFDVAHLDPDNNLKITRNANIDNYISWRKGELRFDDVSASDLLAEVGRAYDLNFVMNPPDNALMQIRLSATLMETSTDGIIEVVSMLLNVDAHRKGRTVSLVKRGSVQ